MLFRDLIRLLSGERPRLGWWAVLLALSILFAIIELVGSLAVLALMRLFLEGGAATSLEVAGLTLRAPEGVELGVLRAVLASGLLGLFVVRALLMVAVGYLSGRLSTMASVRIARRLLDGYLHLPYVEHTRRRSSDMVRDTFVSTERLHERATRPLATLATDAVVTAGLVGALLIVDPLVTAAAGAFLTAATLTVQRVVRPRIRRWGEQSQVATSASLESLEQALSGLRDIRLLGQESRFLRQHDRERRRLARYRYLSVAAQNLPRSLVELATIATIVGVLLLVGPSDPGGTEVLPVLATFAYVGLRLQPVLNRIVMQVNEVRSSQGLVTDLRRELQEVDARPEREEQDPGPEVGNDIRLRGVSFAYPSDVPEEDRGPVLHDVDLEVPEGSFVGIVGPTGGGKSTLLDLLVGLLNPTSGTVTVGGRTLGPAPAWWWRRLGVVSQAVYLVPTTIRENVALGADDPDHPDVEQRIWECLETAQLASTVRALPAGLDTSIGEDGVRLSGGQRQRVALARAVFRDPPVIVLDEATSALDQETEAGVMRAFRATHGAGRRTLIVVTHRLATVEGADRVYVVEAGRVAVRGG